MKFASRLNLVQESQTLKLNALVTEMRAQGKNVVNLTAGEPDFPATDPVKEAAIRAIRENKNKYTAVPGIPELRSKIALLASQRHRTKSKTHAAVQNSANTATSATTSAAAVDQGASKDIYSGKNVIVSNGGKQAIFLSLMALLDAGDEVIIPSPYWLSYPDMVLLNGGTPVALQTTRESGYKLNFDSLKKVFNLRTRVLILNSPSNPTGAMYSKEELSSIGDWVGKLKAPDQEVWIISDEIYEELTFGEVEFSSFVDACPEWVGSCITVNGLSKASALTGWRIGWAIGPEALIQKVSVLQGQVSSNINSVAQYAALAALDEDAAVLKHNRDTYRLRRDQAYARLGKIKGLEVFKPFGAFYFFCSIRDPKWVGKADALSFELLEKHGLAVVPGTSFGDSNSFRISFSVDDESLKRGCEILDAFFA